MNGTTLTIGRLAAAADVNVETVRYYQRIGLMVVPPNAPGKVRGYGAAELKRLRFIRRAQELGFTLDEVRQLLGLADETHCAETRELAQQKLNAVRARLKDLRAMERVLSKLVAQCRVSTKLRGCPIIERLGEL